MDHFLTALVVLFISTVGVIVLAPPLIGFALTVAVASGWCTWLERQNS